MVGSEGMAFLEFRFVPCSRYDAAMKQLSDLDGGDAYAGACAQYENGLPGANRSETDQHVPGGHEDEWDASGLVEVERVGDGDDIGGGYGNQLAVPAIDRIAQHGKFTTVILQT